MLQHPEPSPALADPSGDPRRSGHEEAQELAEWEAAHDEIAELIEAAQSEVCAKYSGAFSRLDPEKTLEAALNVLVYLKHRKPQADPASAKAQP